MIVFLLRKRLPLLDEARAPQGASYGVSFKSLIETLVRHLNSTAFWLYEACVTGLCRDGIHLTERLKTLDILSAIMPLQMLVANSHQYKTTDGHRLFRESNRYGQQQGILGILRGEG